MVKQPQVVCRVKGRLWRVCCQQCENIVWYKWMEDNLCSLAMGIFFKIWEDNSQWHVGSAAIIDSLLSLIKTKSVLFSHSGLINDGFTTVLLVTGVIFFTIQIFSINRENTYLKKKTHSKNGVFIGLTLFIGSY